MLLLLEFVVICDAVHKGEDAHLRLYCLEYLRQH